MTLLGLGIVALCVLGVFLYSRHITGKRDVDRAQDLAVADSRSSAEQERKDIILSAKEEALRLRQEVEGEIRERRSELARLEQRAAQREETFERRRRDIESGEQKLEGREKDLETLRQENETRRLSIAQELERVAALSRDEARRELLDKVEADLTPEVAERIRSAEIAVREEANEKARGLLISTMQRYASEETGEASVTVVHLPSDDLKGRVIGREGRNIRALESATGVDVIVDETPESVVLSSFDPVRREVARMTLEKLFSDGRIHPARIEETVAKSRNELQQKLREAGEEACQGLGIQNIHPELATLLGTLKFRTAYGQNVLAHSVETASIAGMLAAEVGCNEQEVKEAALFHDIGKAVQHDVDGSHALIGGEILSRLGRPANVVHAVRAHHYEEEPRTPGAFLLMTADAISASRRGARRESLALSIKRLERLEAIANDFAGVERSFAVQAGKEIRVMVTPSEVSDDQATVIARQIAKRLHAEGTYTGRIKVTVLRETRSVEYAK